MRLGELMKRFSCLALCAGLLTISSFASTSAIAADAAATAMSQFNAKQYLKAKASFRTAITARPRDSTLYYYFALCQQHLGDIAGARATYMEIIKFFPGSDAAMQAGGILGVLDRTSGSQASAPTAEEPPPPAAVAVPTRTVAPQRTTRTSPAKTANATSSRGGGGGSVSGPDECNIRFEKLGNSLLLDAMVNNRPTKMIFDTGAESCVFGKNHLQQMGISAPTGRPVGQSMGVGDGGSQDVWTMPVSLTVGPITRKDFTVAVQQEMGVQPLLGQTFFQDFTYTIDNGANNIHLRRKNKPQGSIYQSSKNDPNAVPFTREGNEIVVQALINGKTFPVIFDTGADGCCFSKQQIKALGISVPADARMSSSNGIAGATMTSNFPISSLRVGPIEKRDFEVGMVESSQMDHPLLGQTFYGDWQFTIDYENKYIHFLRR
jgi:predicted aspartyl protease